MRRSKRRSTFSSIVRRRSGRRGERRVAARPGARRRPARRRRRSRRRRRPSTRRAAAGARTAAGRVHSRVGVRAVATVPPAPVADRADQRAAAQFDAVRQRDDARLDDHGVRRAVEHDRRAGRQVGRPGGRDQAHPVLGAEPLQGRASRRTAPRPRPGRPAAARAADRRPTTTADDGTASSVVPAVCQASAAGAPRQRARESDDAAGADPLAHVAGRVAGAAGLQGAVDDHEHRRLGGAGEDELLAGARVHPARVRRRARRARPREAGRARRRAARRGGAARPARHGARRAAGAARASARRARPRRSRPAGAARPQTTATSSSRAGQAGVPQAGDQAGDPVGPDPPAEVDGDDQPQHREHAVQRDEPALAVELGPARRAAAQPCRRPTRGRGPAGWGSPASPSAGSSRRARGTG